ncbi:MAG: hypothetical protein IJK04_14595, partial [Kiritimatiellae bacterium]|nr:hypothetical protein [Kiritimatiellia bacterium]
MDLSTLGVRHDDVIRVTIKEETAQAATAYIDDVAPGFTDVRLRNGDDGQASVSWKTYKPEKSDVANGNYVYEDTTGACFLDVTA